MFLHKSRGFRHSGTLRVRISVPVYCMRVRPPACLRLFCVFFISSLTLLCNKLSFLFQNVDGSMWRNKKAVILKESDKRHKFLAVKKLNKRARNEICINV